LDEHQDIKFLKSLSFWGDPEKAKRYKRRTAYALEYLHQMNDSEPNDANIIRFPFNGEKVVLAELFRQLIALELPDAKKAIPLSRKAMARCLNGVAESFRLKIFMHKRYTLIDIGDYFSSLSSTSPSSPVDSPDAGSELSNGRGLLTGGKIVCSSARSKFGLFIPGFSIFSVIKICVDKLRTSTAIANPQVIFSRRSPVLFTPITWVVPPPPN